MRLLLVSLLDLVLLAIWPLRLLLRMVFGHRAPAIVEVRIKGPLRYRDQQTPWRLLRTRRSPPTPSLYRLARDFQRLAREPGSLGVVLHVQDASGSQAQWDALAAMVADLQSKGRRVAVYAETLDGAAYAALCGARFIAMPPGGALDLVGLYAEITSLGPALQKLGVRPDFVRRESHKTAPELFTDSEPSPVQLAQTSDILDRRFAKLIADLGRRSLSHEAARKLVDGGPYTGRTALAAGLIDEVLFHDQLPARIAELWGGPKPRSPEEGFPGIRSLTSSGRIPSLGLRPLRPPPAVGLVSLEGVIRSGRSGGLPLIGRFCGSESAAEALSRARRNRRVRSIVVTIDSRGGAALASEIMWREIRRTADAKPTLIYIDRIAASGGYLAACGADRLLAAPFSILGSIGVFAGRFEVQDLLRRLGIRRAPLQRGARAGLAAKSGPLDATEREALVAGVEETYQAFLALVATARHKDLAAVRELAQGKVYSGAEAQELGLVDGIATFEAAIAEAARRAGITGQDPPVVSITIPAGSGLLQRAIASLLPDMRGGESTIVSDPFA
jgi:protease-4